MPERLSPSRPARARGAGPEIFGHLPDGRAVHRIALTSGRLAVRCLTLGAAIQDLRLEGVDWPLTLGAEDVAAYLGPLAYFGVLVGPVANRVRGGRMHIGGVDCQMPLHPWGDFTLHSGPEATQARLWRIEDHAQTDDRASVTLALDLPDGACGLPGARMIRARYALDGNRLRLTLSAQSDRLTPFNMANHSYWNLDGTARIGGHSLQVHADRVLETDAQILPTGRMVPVAGSHLDLRAETEFDPGPNARFDHTYVLNEAAARDAADGPAGAAGGAADGAADGNTAGGAPDAPLTRAAVLRGRRGVTMTLRTTEPTLQVFDAVNIDSRPFDGLAGPPYGPHCGVALEAQRHPDAVNVPEFPSILIGPDQTYRQTTEWQFDRE
ncbi:aldose epimerase family protein [Brevirhabdus sp.]|uniref:aldose epimerase family protein n=1 Tax=Brevirhabdus sp. TaxID=2004514 RepID=UPI0040584987